MYNREEESEKCPVLQAHFDKKSTLCALIESKKSPVLWAHFEETFDILGIYGEITLTNTMDNHEEESENFPVLQARFVKKFDVLGIYWVKKVPCAIGTL